MPGRNLDIDMLNRVGAIAAAIAIVSGSGWILLSYVGVVNGVATLLMWTGLVTLAAAVLVVVIDEICLGIQSLKDRRRSKRRERDIQDRHPEWVPHD